MVIRSSPFFRIHFRQLWQKLPWLLVLTLPLLLLLLSTTNVCVRAQTLEMWDSLSCTDPGLVFVRKSDGWFKDQIKKSGLYFVFLVQIDSAISGLADSDLAFNEGLMNRICRKYVLVECVFVFESQHHVLGKGSYVHRVNSKQQRWALPRPPLPAVSVALWRKMTLPMARSNSILPSCVSVMLLLLESPEWQSFMALCMRPFQNVCCGLCQGWALAFFLLRLGLSI